MNLRYVLYLYLYMTVIYVGTSIALSILGEQKGKLSCYDSRRH